MQKVSRVSIVLAIFALATAACGATSSTDGETAITALDPGGTTPVRPITAAESTTLTADSGVRSADAGGIATAPVTATTGSLRVRVEGLQSTTGKFAWALFNEAGSAGFPEGARYREARIVPPATAFTLDFDQLPTGRYALSVYHDTNSNDMLDKGVFGQPTERWGSTNNVTHTFSGPTFDESAVDVQKGFRTTTKVVLHD